MKKILILSLLTLCFCSCYQSENNRNSNNNEEKKERIDCPFVLIYRGGVYDIVYDKETMVEYVMSTGCYNYGNVTVMVDSCGNPKIYKK